MAARKKQIDLLDKFKNYVLENGQFPPTVFKFCKDLGIEEQSFYDKYASFEVLDQLVWKQMIVDTLAVLDEDDVFEEYSIHERVLSYYYTHLEILKEHRSYILATATTCIQPFEIHKKLRQYKAKFEPFFERLMAEGVASGDLISTKYFAGQYHKAFWIHNLLLIKYWMQDTSTAFEKTDAAVEKSVKVMFDLIGQGTLDNAVDLVKFLFETK